MSASVGRLPAQAAAAKAARAGLALEAEGLRKRFRSTVAVDGLSFAVRAGEVVGLLGPNGAGKTTTISCIAGLLEPDEGTVRIDGADVRANSSEVRAGLAVSTQRLAIYPGLSVHANLRFYALLYGASPSAAKAAISDIAEMLQIGDLMDRLVRDLSVGQQRLVHVASSIVSRPRLLILDEPTAGLDVMARRLVVDVVQHLASTGVAVLYSTHYLAEVEEIASRVVIIHRGQLIAEGGVDELVAAHGDGQVEIVLDDEVLTTPGVDLGAALAAVPSLASVRSARVIRPSLETVFLSLTGESITDLRETAQ